VKERKQGNTKIDIVSFDAIDWLISQLENRLEDSWDNIVMITGQERSGKSTLGFHIFEKLAERLGKEFIEKFYQRKDRIKEIDEQLINFVQEEWELL